MLGLKNIFSGTKAWLFILIFAMGTGANAGAEDDKQAERDEKQFVVAPMVLSNPSFGSGGGVVGMYFYRPSPEDTISPPSNVSAMGVYSDTDSYFIGVFNQSYLREDHWRLRMGLVNGRINNELDIPDIGTAKFTTDINGLFARSEKRVIGDLFLGVKGSYLDVSYKEDNQESRDYFELYEVEDSSTASLGLVASYDSRDNTRFPYKGMLAELGVSLYPESFGSEENYHVLEGQANLYHEVRRRQILALRGYGRFTPSDTPYVGLSTLGRRSDLRGYTSGENVAENLLSAQAEYRWMFAPKWGVVGFAGVAALYDGGMDNIESDNVFFSGGFGFRYVLHEENRVNFRVDFAWGEDDEDGFYVSVSEAF